MKGLASWIGFFFATFGIILHGCGRHESHKDKLQVYKEAESIPASPTVEVENKEPLDGNSSDLDEIQHRKIIYTCFLDLQVEDVDTTFRKVQEIVQRYQGYFSLVQRNQFYSEKTVSLRAQIRIPVSHLEKAIEELRALAKYEVNYEIRAADVTEEYIDVQARLKVKRELEAQYLDLLMKAKSVKEVLEVQEALAQVRSEIESLEGRLKFLKNQTDYATIHLTLEEYVTSGLPLQVGFWAHLGKSIEEGWEMFLTFILVVVSLWPFWLLGILIIVGWRFFRARFGFRFPFGKRKKIKGETES